MVVEVGDTVTLRDWLGEWVTLNVKKLGTSPEYGEVVTGVDIDDGKQRTLPLDRLVETAKATNISHGKWDLTLPDGSVERLRSLAKIKAYCEEKGFVLVEE